MALEATLQSSMFRLGAGIMSQHVLWVHVDLQPPEFGIHVSYS